MARVGKKTKLLKWDGFHTNLESLGGVIAQQENHVQDIHKLDCDGELEQSKWACGSDPATSGTYTESFPPGNAADAQQLYKKR